MSITSIQLPSRPVSFAGLLIILSSTWGFAQSVYEQLEIRSPLPTPSHITNLQYGNGKFLATTDLAGIILSSDDGIAWESHQTGYSGTMSDIAFGNGIYIVTSAGSGPAYFSSDLENWTLIGSHLLPTNNDNVYFHNGLFYFGGAQWGDDPGISTTANGVDFTDVPTPGEDGIRDMVFANNQFVAVGDSLEIMTSPDGTNWTTQTVDVGIGETELGRGLLSVRYLNSLYVVGGKDKTILTSPDGITWTKRNFEEDNSWFWDSWHDGTKYYFPGRQLKLWTTTDWTTWEAVELVADRPSDVYNIVNQEGITVVTGRDGLIFTSTDQSAWTDRRTGFSEGFPSVAFGAGLFVSVGWDGTAINSVDGVSWSVASPPGLNNSWDHIIFADGKFVAMNGRGEWSLSADGMLWSAVSDEWDPFPGITRHRYLNGKWYVVGDHGLIRSSNNLSDWLKHDLGVDTELEDIAFGNGVYVAVGRNGAIYSSADGTTFLMRETNTTRDMWGIAYGNGKWVALGGSGTALTSEDGINWSAEGQTGNPSNTETLYFRDGQFIALASFGRFVLSSDGLNWKTVQAQTGAHVREIAQSEDYLVGVGQDGLILSGPVPPQKSLTVDTVGEGEIDVSPNQSLFPHQADVTLTATAAEDYAFSFWSGDISSDENPLVFEIDSDKSITANFVLAVTGYRLWVYQNFNEAERDDDEKSGPGADFDVDGLTNNEEYELGTNPKEKNGPHDLTVNISGEGTVELSPPGGGPYTYATEVTVTATGTPEFAFTGWSGDASGSTNPLVVTMDEDKTITANFSLDLDGFSLFRYTTFNEEERVDDSLAGPQADYDGDGLNNFEEYLLRSNPKVPDFGKGVQMGTVEVSGDSYLIIKYSRAQDIFGVTQTVEVGDNLGSWDSGPAYSEIYAVDDNGDGTETVTVRILDPIDSLPRWFVRLVLEET